MRVTVTQVSRNVKTGPIPVSTTEEASCPDECPLKGTNCYARFGPLGMHWRKVIDKGMEWWEFCKKVRKFRSFQLWRHNQAGDLPQLDDGTIDGEKCEQLSEASKHTRGWTYTHYDPTNEHNAEVIGKMNAVTGMTVNLSSDNLTQADEYYDLGIGPVVTILPLDSPTRQNKTPNGIPIVICPAQTQEQMSCDICKLCQIRDRKSIVGFLAHGTAKKRLSEKLTFEV